MTRCQFVTLAVSMKRPVNYPNSGAITQVNGSKFKQDPTLLFYSMNSMPFRKWLPSYCSSLIYKGLGEVNI